MRSTRRVRWLSDREVLDRPDDLYLMRAVAAGRVARGVRGGETSPFPGHYLDGQLVRMELRHLAEHELISMPISGPPTLAPRGWRLLAAANGEHGIAADPD